MRTLLALIVLCASAACAQILPPATLTEVRAGIREVYNLEHDLAIRRFERMVREHPGDPAGYAYLAWSIWLKELAGLQELSIDRFADSDFFSNKQRPIPMLAPPTDRRIRELNAKAQELALDRWQHNSNDQGALFLLGFAYQTMASLEVSLRRSWYAAFRAGSKTFRYHRELLKINSEAHDARLANGVYLYVAGSLRWVEKLVAIFAGYYGDKERGKQELELAAEKATLVNDDARVILALIYARERQYDAALRHIGELAARYRGNYLLRLEQGGLHLRRRDFDAAIGTYQALLTPDARVERSLVYNRLGVAYREKGDFVQATGWFARVLADRGASARSGTIARLELGRCLDRMGRRADAERYWREVLDRQDVAGSREEAKRLLRR
jgi:tetratricopeptide (TPR) repeat protein